MLYQLPHIILIYLANQFLPPVLYPTQMMYVCVHGWMSSLVTGLDFQELTRAR